MADAMRDNRTARAANNAMKKFPHLIRRGEKHHAAHLTNDDVRTIRARHQQGDSLQTLARDYACTKSNISVIVRGKTWRHLL
jgi:Mor family transcriptional regulator